jgi:hypothetical protein
MPCAWSFNCHYAYSQVQFKCYTNIQCGNKMDTPNAQNLVMFHAQFKCAQYSGKIQEVAQWHHQQNKK